MTDELQASLQNYVLQLQQVDAALSIDADNEELKKLKKDLEEVLALTKDLIQQQLAETRKGKDEDQIRPRADYQFSVGDSCLAMSSDDGKYYEAVIEDITEDGEQVSVKFDHTGVVEVTVFAFLKPIRHKSAKKKEERKQSESQREYQKRRKLKKQTRHKQLEEEREHEKNKWLSFTAKANIKKKGNLLTKKSIFASPESVAGRVGIGTCGVSGLPMTEYAQAEKRKKGT